MSLSLCARGSFLERIAFLVIVFDLLIYVSAFSNSWYFCAIIHIWIFQDKGFSSANLYNIITEATYISFLAVWCSHPYLSSFSLCWHFLLYYHVDFCAVSSLTVYCNRRTFLLNILNKSECKVVSSIWPFHFPFVNRIQMSSSLDFKYLKPVNLNCITLYRCEMWTVIKEEKW